MTAKKKPGPAKGAAGPVRGLTPERHLIIHDALEAGARVEDAAALAGIAPRTLYLWLARGKTEMERIDAGVPADPAEDPYLQLMQSATRARAAVGVEMLGYWKAAAKDDWRAARDFIARDISGLDVTSGERLDRMSGELTSLQARVVVAAMRTCAARLTGTAVDHLDAAGVPSDDLRRHLELAAPAIIQTALQVAEREVHDDPPALEAP